MSLFLIPGSEHRVGCEFFNCEDAAFVKTPVFPRLVFGNAVPTHLIKYRIQPLRDRTFWQHFTVFPRRWTGTAFVLGKYQISDVKYIWNNSYLNCGWRWKWRMIIAINFCGLDKSRSLGSGISPALANAFSTFLSCCSQHFSFPRSRSLCTSSGGHAQ